MSRKVTNSPYNALRVATERKHRWALPPPVAWVISVLCWLSVFLYIFVSLSLPSQIIRYDCFLQRISPQQLAEESSIFLMSSEEQ